MNEETKNETESRSTNEMVEAYNKMKASTDIEKYSLKNQLHLRISLAQIALSIASSYANQDNMVDAGFYLAEAIDQIEHFQLTKKQ